MDTKEIARICRAVRIAKQDSGKRVRYPHSIKESVLAIIGQGMSAAEISRETGLNPATIFKWTQNTDKVSFRRVRVSSSKSQKTELSESVLKVTLPNGICFEGASVAVLKEILGWFE